MSTKPSEEDTIKLRKGNGDCVKCGAHMWGYLSHASQLIGGYYAVGATGSATRDKLIVS